MAVQLRSGKEVGNNSRKERKEGTEEEQEETGKEEKKNDECLKHSYYTRVGFSFSRLFYSNFIVFVARLLN